MSRNWRSKIESAMFLSRWQVKKDGRMLCLSLESD